MSGHHTPATAFTKRFDPTHLLNFSDSPAVTVQDCCFKATQGTQWTMVLGFLWFNSGPFSSELVTLCVLPWLPMLPKQGSSTNSAFWLQFVLTLGIINLTWSSQIPNGHTHWTVWKEGWDGGSLAVGIKNQTYSKVIHVSVYEELANLKQAWDFIQLFSKAWGGIDFILTCLILAWI